MPGWNWLGYPMDQVMSLDEALTNLPANDGDALVGMTGSADFVEGAWIGDLSVMTPGQGYMLKSSSSNEFLYNTAIVSRAKSIRSGGLKRNVAPWSVDEHRYSDVMPLRALLYRNETPVDEEQYTEAA